MADGFRYRVCFRKSGRLRHLSHLELARACERAARRAALPYAVSRGFTPRMRIAFGPALPVGTAGEREYYDLLLHRYEPAAELQRRLGSATVRDLGPVASGYVGHDEPSLTAALTIASYDVEVEGGSPQETESALHSLIDSGRFEVDHKGKRKVFSLAEALPKEPEVSEAGESVLVRLHVRMGEGGSLRPERLIAAVAPQARRIVVTRTGLFSDVDGEWRSPL